MAAAQFTSLALFMVLLPVVATLNHPFLGLETCLCEERFMNRFSHVILFQYRYHFINEATGKFIYLAHHLHQPKGAADHNLSRSFLNHLASSVSIR